ncbi:MAG: hypothetical protein KAS32_08065, partial [Candidatus Peribacteraceae bacterium]|nr:hypothetical protein [Candidatus Peribacteraceae bacterium]
DSPGDANGYGHVSGNEDGSTDSDEDDCEIWFDITQNDGDGDGLTYWQEVKERAPGEAAYGTDPTTPTVDDIDGDGLASDIEYSIGTKPTMPDSDGDGIWDGYEHCSAVLNPMHWGDSSNHFQEIVEWSDMILGIYDRFSYIMNYDILSNDYDTNSPIGQIDDSILDIMEDYTVQRNTENNLLVDLMSYIPDTPPVGAVGSLPFNPFFVTDIALGLAFDALIDEIIAIYDESYQYSYRVWILGDMYNDINTCWGNYNHGGIIHQIGYGQGGSNAISNKFTELYDLFAEIKTYAIAADPDNNIFQDCVLLRMESALSIFGEVTETTSLVSVQVETENGPVNKVLLNPNDSSKKYASEFEYLLISYMEILEQYYLPKDSSNANLVPGADVTVGDVAQTLINLAYQMYNDVRIQRTLLSTNVYFDLTRGV